MQPSAGAKTRRGFRAFPRRVTGYGWPTTVLRRVYPLESDVIDSSEPSAGKVIGHAQEIENSADFRIVSWRVDHDSSQRYHARCRHRVRLCPSQIDDLRDGIFRQHHVQATVFRRMDMSELITDHEGFAATAALSMFEAQRFGPRNRNPRWLAGYKGKVEGPFLECLIG